LHSLRKRDPYARPDRERVGHQGCFEILDEKEVVHAILSRGLKHPRLRTALERSHLIDPTHRLLRLPDFAEAYCRSD